MKKLLIITGGSHGIGKATLEHFHQQGWDSICLSRSQAPACANQQINCDLADSTAVNHAGLQLKSSLGDYQRICLIHNACAHINDRVGEQDPAAFAKALQVSLIAASQLNNAIAQQLPPSSSILYIGSTLSELGVAGAASYTAIKHATVGLMRATTQDLASKQIHSACICPGFTDTEMLREHLGDTAALEWAKSRVGAHRLISPKEIAQLCLFCADNPVINGSVLHANLGQLQQ
jgi:NAD(P)-dependent dehydrogenase (short-subunit alcohol dehydrogenase family)